jgi:transposase
VGEKASIFPIDQLLSGAKMEPEPELPTDPQALRQLVVELLLALQAKDRQIGQLSAQLEALRRRIFGRSSEKLNPDQMALDLGAWLAAHAAAAAPEAPEPPVCETETTPRNGGHGRRRLPEHLPRHRTEYHPAPAQRVCRECSAELKKIGEEISEQLEYVPASLFVHEHARIRYACPHCQGNVVIGSLPVQPIAKGLPGPGLLAHVLTSKYNDHLPLNRLEGIFQRQGVALSRSTLCDWVAASATLLEPLVGVMKTEVLASRKIHTDDTPVPVLDKDRESTKTGRLWVYVGDGDHEHIVFAYTPDRSRDGPLRFLAGYKGYLQADAYTGYDAVYAGQEVIEVACWAHARRKFFAAMKSDAVRVPIALAHIRQLYAIEKRARDLDETERCALRVAEAKPVLDAFKAWLDAEAQRALPKSPLGEAISYARTQWIALTRYLEDGLLELDNNRAERALRRVAIGRKNWMFAGSDEGGRRAAIVYSLIASCAVLKIDPYAYLRDVLERLPSCSPDDLQPLTPKAWKATLDASAAAA